MKAKFFSAAVLTAMLFQTLFSAVEAKTGTFGKAEIIRLQKKEKVAVSRYEVLGVIFEKGKISIAEAGGVLGVLIRKNDEASAATDKLVVKVFDDKGSVITQKSYSLNATVKKGTQHIGIEGLSFTNASYLQAHIETSKGVVVSPKGSKISQGSYKGLPLLGDWITNEELGNGPGVQAPTKVPAGVNPQLVNTKTSNVNYSYNENYPAIRANNMLWYKTGAYDVKSTIYDRDGADWEQQALPIGNGFMGAMLFGMPGKDHIQFNEETFWAAGYRGVQKGVDPTYVNPDMSEGINGYMNAGNIFIDFNLPSNPQIVNYYRDLNLEDAVAHVQYEYNNVKYNREYFASFSAKVLVFRYTADKAGALNFTVNPVSAHPGSITVNNGEITIVGNLKDSEPYRGGGRAAYSQKSDLEYCTKIKVIADNGKITDNYANVGVEGATAVTVIVASSTDYDPNQFVIGKNGKVDLAAKQFKHLKGLQYTIDKTTSRLAGVKGKSFEKLKAEHIADYQKLFNRVSFRLTDEKEVSQIPTNELQLSYNKVIPLVNKGASIAFAEPAYNSLNKHLEELHYNYARYLMIASSRETTLPANLQGKWNQSVAEIWGSTYCININLQMNYWFAGGANLLESGKALINWFNSQIPAGRITSKNMYKIEPKSYTLTGNTISFANKAVPHTDDVFIMHTKQSINGQTDMTGSRNIQSPGNTAFMMYNLWDLYLSSGDKKLLAAEIYPIMRKSANFYTQYIYANKKSATDTKNYPKGYYYTTGSGRSPEQGPTQEGVKYDLQLVAGMFDYTIQAAEILGEDKDKVAAWKEIRNNIEIPVELGADKQIKEWAQETSYNTDASGKAMGDPYHRHISHLVALYPGTLINPTTPELLKGAKITLEKRGDDATGWSIANKFLMWARVLDGDKALQLFRYQLAQRTYSNLFDFHAPFQIDGNFGSAAGVMELLMQSQTGTIYILPALPKVWDKGSVAGIRAKTGADVSLKWSGNKADEVVIRPVVNGDVRIGYKLANSIIVSDGVKSSTLAGNNGIFTITGAKAGAALKISFR
ncbi:MAG: glycoside hydrolase family 95 protein [Sphingobacteriaceae bacterium]|nr:glycoside hydrolase family 95 protein [Sphingobacteriaceae bacterium]